MRIATYLYGFARPRAEVPPDLQGIDGTPVCLLAIAGLAAFVGEVAPEPFQSDATTDPGWLVPRALRHERVIEAMRCEGPVMPVRFGALFTTTRALEDWAVENRESIERFLGHVEDKDEWTIRLSLHLACATEGLAGVDPEWAARVRSLPESPGARYLRKKRLDEEALQEVRRRSRDFAARVRAAAGDLAEERVLALRKADSAGIEPILSAAYLVPRAAAPAFHERVAAAGGLPFLRMDTSGPWVPSHFCPSLTAAGR